jgi:hypothetical protein
MTGMHVRMAEGVAAARQAHHDTCRGAPGARDAAADERQDRRKEGDKGRDQPLRSACPHELAHHQTEIEASRLDDHALLHVFLMHIVHGAPR